MKKKGENGAEKKDRNKREAGKLKMEGGKLTMRRGLCFGSTKMGICLYLPKMTLLPLKNIPLVTPLYIHTLLNFRSRCGSVCYADDIIYS